MVLREQGKIDLDCPINEYMGEAKLRARVGDARDATVRRVANHTAGLPLHFQFFFADEPYRPPAIEETIRRYGNLVTAPGETFTYSNLGYGILGHLLSRVSGRSWGEFLRAEVFEPLGLTRTAVEVPAGLAESVAVRYGRDGLPLPEYTTDHPGASAIFSSAHDLVRFGLFHTRFQIPGQETILPDRAIEEMQRPASTAEADRIYGVGWFLGASRTGQASIAHAGGMDGVSTRLYLVPSDGVVITILANADTELPGQVFREILPPLLGDAAREVPQQPAQPVGSARVGPRPLETLKGTWSGQVHTYPGQLPFRLRCESAGRMRAKLGEAAEADLDEVDFRNGVLTGALAGDVGTVDANRLPYRLLLSLRLRPGDILNGAVTARSLVGLRLGNALSHWTELRRERGASR
jgi:CubicO group peptidase (beta-lactamase class C family)